MLLRRIALVITALALTGSIPACALASEVTLAGAGEEAAKTFEQEVERASENGHLVCVVPKLKGDSLSSARKALAARHCVLGFTNRPATRRRGRLVVVGQRPGAGTRLTAGSAVSVTLAWQRPHRRRHR